MAARLTKWTPEVVRERIKTSHLVRGLYRHFKGLQELSPTQLRAAEILLRKTLPDQSAIAHTGRIGIEKPEELSEAELDRRIALASGKETQTPGEKELSELH
jgi:hypothetical protein